MPLPGASSVSMTLLKMGSTRNGVMDLFLKGKVRVNRKVGWEKILGERTALWDPKPKQEISENLRELHVPPL